jgi:hypothetical protein
VELHEVLVEVCVDIGVDSPVNLFALLEQTAQRFPDRGAVYYGERRCCTWRELRDWGLSQDQAYKVISDGIKVYCPEKDGALRLPENFNH